MERSTERLVTGRLAENEEIDHMLSHEDEILPSSGFAVAVMDAVRREAAAPPPIPFPWKRALPGLVVGGLVLVFALVAGVVAIVQLATTSTIPQVSASVPSLGQLGLHGDLASATSWAALALLIAFVSVKLSMRLASGRT
ncbi:MAG: hypothetical protein WBD25_01530 [Terriglobales bacterium]|jgi:hypothetical protein